MRKRLVLTSLIALLTLSCGESQETEIGIPRSKVVNKPQQILNEYRPSGHIVTDDQVVAEITDGANFDGVNLNMQANVTDKSLKHVADTLPELRSLHFDSPKITDGGMKQVGRLKKLEILSTGKSEFTDDGLAFIGEMKALEYLFVRASNVSNKGLEHLVKLPHLKELVLYGTDHITHEGIEYLSQIDTLESLTIRYGDSNINGPGLASL